MFTDADYIFQKTIPNTGYSAESPDTVELTSMTIGSGDQGISEFHLHPFHLEEKSPFICLQRRESKKKSEEISEHEHSWSIILSQTEASDTSPEDTFSRTDIGDGDKDLVLYEGYDTQEGSQTAIRDNDYGDLEESFELCKMEDRDTKANSAITSHFSYDKELQSKLSPEGGACAPHLGKNVAEQR